MRHITSILLLPLLLISLNANAFLITDTYVVEKQIPKNTWEGHKFELIPAGYSPETDSITHIKIIYDFTEIISSTNLGDRDFFNEDDPEDLTIDPAHYEDESVILSSWLINWREWEPDIDTGLTIFETDRTRNNLCQFEAFDWQNEDIRWCEYNIDVDGTMNAHVLSQSDHLWLHSIKVEVEVDRAEVPEPHPLLLLAIGLLAIGLLRNHKIKIRRLHIN